MSKRLRRAGDAAAGRCLGGRVDGGGCVGHIACGRLLGCICKRLAQRLLIHAMHRVLQRLAGVALCLGHGLGKAVQPLLGQCVHGSVFAFVKQAVQLLLRAADAGHGLALILGPARFPRQIAQDPAKLLQLLIGQPGLLQLLLRIV